MQTSKHTPVFSSRIRECILRVMYIGRCYCARQLSMPAWCPFLYPHCIWFLSPRFFKCICDLMFQLAYAWHTNAQFFSFSYSTLQFTKHGNNSISPTRRGKCIFITSIPCAQILNYVISYSFVCVWRQPSWPFVAEFPSSASLICVSKPAGLINSNDAMYFLCRFYSVTFCVLFDVIHHVTSSWNSPAERLCLRKPRHLINSNDAIYFLCRFLFRKETARYYLALANVTSAIESFFKTCNVFSEQDFHSDACYVDQYLQANDLEESELCVALRCEIKKTEIEISLLLLNFIHMRTRTT